MFARMFPVAGRVVLALVLLMGVAGPGRAMDGKGVSGRRASWEELQSLGCVRALVAAEKRHQTLPGLVTAIARAESGRPIPPLPGLQPWPWAVNADGAAMYFESKAAAVTWTRMALNQGARQVDVGCMQINLQSHPNAFASLEEAFEPATNTDYAARFLRQLNGDAGGNWYIATGYYHSRTPLLAATYRQRVAEIADGRIPATTLGIPLYMRAIAQGTLRIPLAGGRVMKINLSRQPGRTRKPMSACQVASVLGSFMAPQARAACATSARAENERQTRYGG